jgi:hypothetical protein
MAGVVGFLLRSAGKSHIVISVHLLQRSIAVEVDSASVMLLPREGPENLPNGPAVIPSGLAVSSR